MHPIDVGRERSEGQHGLVTIAWLAVADRLEPRRFLKRMMEVTSAREVVGSHVEMLNIRQYARATISSGSL